MENNDITCSVLIVDDDNDLCEILAAVIIKICAVHVEHTLKSAEIYLSKLKPVIILLDNNLPDGTGVSHIKSILALYPDVKIVIMTADISVGLREMAIEEGAVKFITKPFRAKTLNEIIFSICAELRAA